MSVPVSSDVRLVTDASQSDAVELSAQSPGYGASYAGLTDSRGPHKAEDGSLKTKQRHETDREICDTLKKVFVFIH